MLIIRHSAAGMDCVKGFIVLCDFFVRSRRTNQPTSPQCVAAAGDVVLSAPIFLSNPLLSTTMTYASPCRPQKAQRGCVQRFASHGQLEIVSRHIWHSVVRNLSISPSVSETPAISSTVNNAFLNSVLPTKKLHTAVRQVRLCCWNNSLSARSQRRRDDLELDRNSRHLDESYLVPNPNQVGLRNKVPVLS